MSGIWQVKGNAIRGNPRTKNLIKRHACYIAIELGWNVLYEYQLRCLHCSVRFSNILDTLDLHNMSWLHSLWMERCLHYIIINTAFCNNNYGV